MEFLRTLRAKAGKTVDASEIVKVTPDSMDYRDCRAASLAQFIVAS
jgi:hypothetical protein